MNQLVVIATNACGWPNLIKLNNGQVLCTYFNAPSHGLMEGDLVCSLSDRNRKKWKKLSVVAKKPKGGNRMHLAVGQAHNGDLLCFNSGFFVKDEKFVGFSGHWLSRSKDRGKSWEVQSNPVVPKGIILLRLIPTSSHNENDINETLDAFASIREKLKDGVYKKSPEGIKESAD